MGREQKRKVQSSAKRDRQPHRAAGIRDRGSDSTTNVASDGAGAADDALAPPCRAGAMMAQLPSWLPAAFDSGPLWLWRACCRLLFGSGPRADQVGVAADEQESGQKDVGKSPQEQLLRVLFRRRDPSLSADPAVEEACRDYLSGEHCAGRQGPRDMLILRGPPGIGKSTYALDALSKRLGVVGELSVAQRLCHVCSTDDFFTKFRADGRDTYNFEKARLGQNHGRNQERARLAASLHLTPLIVDNTCMTKAELTPYTRIASKARYSVQIILPQDIHPRWNDLEFLEERNRGRTPAGKEISNAVLRKMLERWEGPGGGRGPSAHGGGRSKVLSGLLQAAVAPRKAADPLPQYLGLNVDGALGTGGQRCGLVWEPMAQAIAGSVSKEALQLKRYTVPSPLHVTTFHRNQLGDPALAGPALRSAAERAGTSVTLVIEAVAFAVDGLACAIVSKVEPPVCAPRGKLLHVTLATRGGWKPVESNDLLAAMLAEARSGSLAPRGDEEAELWRFRDLDLSALWQRGSRLTFEDLPVSGRRCRALLVRLPEVLEVSGVHFQCG